MDFSKGVFLDWVGEDRPLEDHGHPSNFSNRIRSMESPEDARACAEFRAAYKRKIDQGVDVSMAIELSYAEMLTPRQINLMGGLTTVYRVAHQYKVSQTKRVM